MLILEGVRVEGLEPPHLAAPDPKSGASTNFATPALIKYKVPFKKALQIYNLLIKKNVDI